MTLRSDAWYDIIDFVEEHGGSLSAEQRITLDAMVNAYMTFSRDEGGGTVMTTPYDPRCQRFARDMEYLDTFIDAGENREDYIRTEEGTYNPENGHFLCDDCYVAAGQPSSPRGWMCP